MQPLPPSPAFTRIVASSINMPSASLNQTNFQKSATASAFGLKLPTQEHRRAADLSHEDVFLPMAAIQGSDEPQIVAPRSAWWELLRDATVEVFSTMVGAAVVVPPVPEGSAIELNPAESVVLA